MKCCSRCLDEGKEVEAEMDSPALLCKPCWDAWFNAPEADDPKWEDDIIRWNFKDNPRT